MEHVNELEGGRSFGQDSLINDTARNATCYAMTAHVITAVLMKDEYKRILQERDVKLEEFRVSQIMKFDMFKEMARNRMKKIYRLFYNPKTL